MSLPTDRRRPPAESGVDTVAATAHRLPQTDAVPREDVQQQSRPKWCGHCDERTRLLEVGEDRRPTRCKLCHPLVVGALPAAAGVDLAIANADEPWMDAALRVIRSLARTGCDFGADEMRDEPYCLTDPDSPARWGAAFRAAQSRGWIELVGHRRSNTPSRAGGALAIWRGRGER